MFSFIIFIFKGTLHKARKKSDIKVVKQHLAADADVNDKDDDGDSPYDQGDYVLLLVYPVRLTLDFY